MKTYKDSSVLETEAEALKIKVEKLKISIEQGLDRNTLKSAEIKKRVQNQLSDGDNFPNIAALIDQS